jgi:hypothetical protein
MYKLRITSMGCVLGAICALAIGCSAGSDGTESVDTMSQALPPGHCSQAVAHDVLIAQLVKDSWLTGYPLTRLYTATSGSIVGPSLPDAVAGDLDIINTIAEARQSVSTALEKVSGLADYAPLGLGADTPACEDIPAWTPTGTTTIDTTSNVTNVGTTNYDSWLETQKQFSKVCPLIKRIANEDTVDPPGDGSTSLPASETVSDTGVRANAYGVCPAYFPDGITPVVQGTYCKLSYATGVNYTGRSCQLYYGVRRCLLY